MIFQDLTNDCCRILTALFQMPSANRQRIADLCQLTATKVSRALNRLEGFGFVDKPKNLGGGWRISEAGRRLFGEPVPMIVATGHAEPVPDPQEPDPQPEPMLAPGESLSEVQQILLENQELNAAMDEVVARLGQGRISATALRTYRRLVDALPPTVQRALTPITRLVEAQP